MREAERKRLVKLIQDSVDGCAENWARVIADYLIESGVIVPQRRSRAGIDKGR